jgi:hypothetical protein
VNDQLERLAAAGIHVVPSGITSHLIVERDGFVAFIERRENALGNIGAPGLATEQGFAALVWRAEQPFFIARGFEQPASGQQVEALRAFASDLERAILSRR